MWTRRWPWWTSGFHKMLGSSRVAAQLAASQEELSSMSEWVSHQWARAVKRLKRVDGPLSQCSSAKVDDAYIFIQVSPTRFHPVVFKRRYAFNLLRSFTNFFKANINKSLHYFSLVQFISSEHSFVRWI
jgi:hypothetical protein